MLKSQARSSTNTPSASIAKIANNRWKAEIALSRLGGLLSFTAACLEQQLRPPPLQPHVVVAVERVEAEDGVALLVEAKGGVESDEASGSRDQYFHWAKIGKVVVRCPLSVLRESFQEKLSLP